MPVFLLENLTCVELLSARNLRGLAERHSDAKFLSCNSNRAILKVELSREAVNLASEFDFKAKGQDHLKSMAIFDNEALRRTFLNLDVS